MSHLDALPVEILQNICRQLDSTTKASCAMTCHALRNVVYDPCMWQRMDVINPDYSAVRYTKAMHPTDLRIISDDAYDVVWFLENLHEEGVATYVRTLYLTFRDADVVPEYSLIPSILQCENLTSLTIEFGQTPGNLTFPDPDRARFAISKWTSVIIRGEFVNVWFDECQKLLTSLQTIDLEVLETDAFTRPLPVLQRMRYISSDAETLAELELGDAVRYIEVCVHPGCDMVHVMTQLTRTALQLISLVVHAHEDVYIRDMPNLETINVIVYQYDGMVNVDIRDVTSLKSLRVEYRGDCTDIPFWGVRFMGAVSWESFVAWYASPNRIVEVQRGGSVHVDV
jgi:hypothetical protein